MLLKIQACTAISAFLVVLGLFHVSIADANWLLEGVETKETIAAQVSAHSTGVMIVKNLGIEIKCTTMESSLVILLTAKSNEGSGQMAFSGCKTYSPIGSGKEVSSCNPETPISIGGKVLIILHEAKNYLLVEPSIGKPFGVIKFSEFCALVETSDIIGSLVLECGSLNKSAVFVGEDCKTSLVTHLVQPAPEALFSSDKIKVGENSATLSGIASARLVLGNFGRSWSGHV